jgi:hypothetical protein
MDLQQRLVRFGLVTILVLMPAARRSMVGTHLTYLLGNQSLYS